MKKKLFLFGAGRVAKNYTKILEELFFEIYGYVDNNSNKWGTILYNRKIYAPEELKKETDIDIIIACTDVNAITMQLSQMGIQEKIVSIDYFIKQGIENIKIKKNYINYSINNYGKKTIIVDNFNGTWGGAEDWSHEITSSLLMRGHNTLIIENTDSNIKNRLEAFTKQIERKNKRIDEIYLELIEWLIQKKPFILFNIWSTEVLWAASYIKKLYPDEIQIISSVLNDNSVLYQRQIEWHDYIDLYLCISTRIKNNLISLYGIDKKKVCYRVPFVKNIRNIEKSYYKNDNSSLKIGYPCRLTSTQKRADLLPRLIEKLEKKCVNYVCNIAGDGPYEKEIVSYINENNLCDKVRFHGKLSREELMDFLREQDIYLNFSEYEGTSLTMLEAMARGCVPVVTNVSGVDDFIENMINGLISDVGNMEDIANNILFLDKNREKIEDFSRKCVDIISNKCDLNEYIDYVEKLVN